jgi:hypothetical protein
MADFAQTISDEAVGRRLPRPIRGKGAAVGDRPVLELSLGKATLPRPQAGLP